MEELTINFWNCTISVENDSALADKVKAVENQCDIAIRDHEKMQQRIQQLQDRRNELEADNDKMDDMLSKIADSIISHVHPEGYKNEDLVDIACNCIESHTKLNDKIKALELKNGYLSHQAEELEMQLKQINSVEHISHKVEYTSPSQESGKRTCPKPITNKQCAKCGVKFLPDHNRTMSCDPCRGKAKQSEPIQTESEPVPSEPEPVDLPKYKNGSFVIDPFANA
jgi:cell division protein FtsB